MKLKIGAKISLGFICMLALVFVLGGTSFFALKTSQNKLIGVESSNKQQVLEMKINASFLDCVAAMRGFIAYGQDKFYVQVEDSLNETLKMENELLNMVGGDQKEEVENLIKQTELYKNGLLNDLSPVVRAYHKELNAGNRGAADNLFAQMNEITAGLVPMTDQINKIIEKLVGENEKLLNGNLNSARQNAGRVMVISVVITVIAIIIGIILSYFLTRGIRNPILEIVSVAQRLSSGDFTKEIEIKSQDEVGDLGIALDKMKSSFKDLLLRIQNSSRLLNESSQQLAAQAQQTSAGATETAATMNEISGSIETMSQNTQEVAGQADVASKHADQGAQGIEMVTGQMQEISAATMQMGTAIDSLNTAINKIGQFVEVITNIADQTNLLALNAAIEAARAGEAGRGFAVVAEEVRKLAEQSAQSTKEIKQLIVEIESESTQAVQAVTTGSEKVSQGNRVVAEVGRNFNEIIKAVQGLTIQVQTVAAAAEEVSAGVQNVAATTEEQTAAMEEVSASTESLSKLSDELNELARMFKF